MNKWRYFVMRDNSTKGLAATNSDVFGDVLLDSGFRSVGWLEYQLYRLTPLWLLKRIRGGV